MLPLQIYWNVYRWLRIKSFSAKLGSLASWTSQHATHPNISNFQHHWKSRLPTKLRWPPRLRSPTMAEYIYSPELKAWELYWVLWIFLDITIHHNIFNFQHNQNLDHQQNWDYHQKLRSFTPVFFLRILWCSQGGHHLKHKFGYILYMKVEN